MANLVKELFKDIDKNNLLNLLDCHIENINLFKKSNKLEIDLTSDKQISLKEIEYFEKYLQNKFNIEQIEFNIKHNINIQADISQDWQEIVSYVSKKYPLTKTILKTSSIQIKDNIVNIEFTTKSADFLRSYKLDKILSNLLLNLYGKKYRVIYQENINNEIKQQQKSYLKQLEKEACKDIVSKIEEKQQQKKAKKEKEFENNDTMIILGRGININEPIINIIDLNLDYLKVAIEGKIVKIDSKELKNGKILISFNIYDKTSTITCKTFIEPKNFDNVFEKLNEAERLRILGKLQYDNFAKEICIMTNVIAKIPTDETNKRIDMSEEKRVELHAHTQMSQMDGTVSATDLIKKAKEFGMKSIAITDHGVVQAFPEAKNASEKYDIKVIYGVEAYIVPDRDEKIEIPEEYCVFDIETTGLAFRTEKITEIRCYKSKKW